MSGITLVIQFYVWPSLPASPSPKEHVLCLTYPAGEPRLTDPLATPDVTFAHHHPSFYLKIFSPVKEKSIPVFPWERWLQAHPADYLVSFPPCLFRSKKRLFLNCVPLMLVWLWSPSLCQRRVTLSSSSPSVSLIYHVLFWRNLSHSHISSGIIAT